VSLVIDNSITLYIQEFKCLCSGPHKNHWHRESASVGRLLFCFDEFLKYLKSRICGDSIFRQVCEFHNEIGRIFCPYLIVNSETHCKMKLN